MTDLVQTRHAAIQAVLAHRGGARAAAKTAQVLNGLRQVVQVGVANETIALPTSKEELAILMDRWLQAATEAAVKVGQEETQEAFRCEGEARALTGQIQAGGGGEVVDLPRVPAAEPPPAPKGRVRRKKDAAAGQ